MRRAYFTVSLTCAIAMFQSALATAAINPHPRLWLPPASLSTLQGRVQANNPEWQTFKTQVDSHFGGLPLNSSSILSAPDYALAYAVLKGMSPTFASPHKALDYGQYAITLTMAAMKAQLAQNCPSGCSNTKPPFEGNDFRNLVSFYALVFDWTYDLLTPAQKAYIVTNLRYSSEYVTSSAYQSQLSFAAGGGPGWNVQSGVQAGIVMMGYATFGDNPTDDVVNQTNYEITSALTQFRDVVEPFYNTGYGVGFVPIEGSEYGWQEPLQWPKFIYSALTASGLDLRPEMPNFLQDCTNWFLYFTSPGPSTQYNGTPTYQPLQYGDLEPDEQYYLQESSREGGLLLANLNSGSSANYIRFWLDNIQPIYKVGWNPFTLRYMDFLFDDPGWSTTDYRSVISTNYQSTGSEYFSLRSNWENTATWVTFNSGYLLTNHAHQQAGHFTIYRNNEWLALDNPGYAGGWQTPEVHNVVMNKGSLDSIWKGPLVFKGQADPTVERYEATETQHVYVRGNTAGAYRSTLVRTTYGDWLNTQSLYRELVYLKPDYVIVYDRGTFRDPTLSRFQLSTPTPPIEINGVVTATNNGQSIFLTPLLPAHPQITLTDLGTVDTFYANVAAQTDQAGLLTFWRTDVQTPTPAQAQTLLQVIQSGDLTTIPAGAELITSGNLVAAHIKDPAGDQVVAFSGSANGADLALPVSYSITSVSHGSSHLIVDLPANTPVNYSISRSSSNIVTVTVTGSSSSQGQAGTTSAAGTLTVTEGTLGTQATTACDLDGTGTVNVVDVQLAINQALGLLPCTTADLTGNGTCTIIDVQRIINAITTGVCNTSP